MSKTLKNYILFTFLIILIFNFSGCTIVEKIEELVFKAQEIQDLNL